MKFPAKASGDFEIVPAGNHVAICNAVIDLGVQKGRGMYPDPKHEIYIRFELPTERVRYQKDGREIEGPMSIGRRFTASMSEKANLRKFIESWFGKKFPDNDSASDFDMELLIGKKCLLNVTHTEKGDKTYANIQGASPIPKGMSADYAQANPALFYDLLDHDPAVYENLPEWLRKIIDDRIDDRLDRSGSRELDPVGTGAAELDDDIPF